MLYRINPSVLIHLILAGAGGLPLGIIFISLSDWLRTQGVSLTNIGLLALLQLPWLARFLIAPLMEKWSASRYGKWFIWLQVSLMACLALMISLGMAAKIPTSFFYIFILAATLSVAAVILDIASVALFTEQIPPQEIAATAGIRNAVNRIFQGVTGGLAIVLSSFMLWGNVQMACACLLVIPIFTLWKNHSTVSLNHVTTLPSWREVTVQPFRDLTQQRHWIALCFFILTFRLSDGLAGLFIRPFLIDLGYSEWHRGITLAIGALGLGIVGTLAGALLIKRFSLRSVTFFAAITQMISNLGYIWLSNIAPAPLKMFLVVAIENFFSGIATSVVAAIIFLAVNPKHAAVQTSILLAIGGSTSVIFGPLSGAWIESAGWQAFMWLTLFAGIPGCLALWGLSPSRIFTANNE